MSSRDINADLYPIVTSVLLNVSPFVLKLVTEYVRDSRRDSFASVRDLLDENREIVRQQLDGGILRYVEPMVKTSVAWFEITDPAWTADTLQAYLLERDVYVLSGKYFYWNNPDRGQRFIRMALARETALFASAIDAIRSALEVISEPEEMAA